MEADEIRAEIERRRKRAVDLKLRETLWMLYYYHLGRYAEQLKKDPEMIHPEIRETLEISDDHVEFNFGESTYRVVYKEGPKEGVDWGSRHRSSNEETTATPVELALTIDHKPVFKFKMERIAQYTPDMPVFKEIMLDVTGFIEGPWVADVPELLKKIKAHEKNVRDKRRAPELEQKLREDMERFGL